MSPAGTHRRRLRALAALALRALAKAAPVAAERLAATRGARWLAGRDTVNARRLGTVMRLNLADNVQRTLFLTGTYASPFLEYLRRELRPGDTYLDVGGHIGIHTLVAARQLAQSGAGEVIVFEPAPDAAAAIRESTYDLPVTVVQAALGDRVGDVELRADARFDSADASTRSILNDGQLVCVAPIVRFDDWAESIHLKRLDVVKIDVEGAEYDALRGMKSAVSRFRPRCITIELQPSRLAQAGRRASDVEALLAEAGYSARERFKPYDVVFRPM